VNAQFSQSEEREADDYGLQFLSRHGYDQYGAVRAFAKLADYTESKGKNASGFRFLSSHPAPRERSERMAKQLGEKGVVPVKVAKAAQAPVEITSVPEVVAAPEKTDRAEHQAAADAGFSRGVKTAKLEAAVDSASAVVSDAPASIGYSAAPAAANKDGAVLTNTHHQAVFIIDELAPGYYVQVKAETLKSLAEDRLAELRSRGITARSQEALVHGTRYFRVLVGPFRSLSGAKARKAELTAAQISEDALFIQDLN
ncbi:MAG TPA: SPOR domain-containing protein, partial [Oligoflexia bacterium]|nr:SPOR domain-containing protein [Oligoflexia bacterium]